MKHEFAVNDPNACDDASSPLLYLWVYLSTAATQRNIIKSFCFVRFFLVVACFCTLIVEIKCNFKIEAASVMCLIESVVEVAVEANTRYD